MEENITFILNGKQVEVTTESSRRLLWVLRTDFALTGTKYGCGENHCGACTVLIENKAVRSCQESIKDVQGKNVVTIEGLAKEEILHPLQKAFMQHDALQCGYCTPGMIMSAYDLLNSNPNPTEEQIIKGMDDNYCRCGAHKRIIDAIQSAALEMKGEVSHE